MTGTLGPFPEKRSGDRMEELALMVVSSVPGIGSPLELFLERLIGPAHERRVETFIRNLAQAVRELQARGFDVEDLPNNEAWVTAVIRASRVAAGTHLEEKLRMLQAAMVNAALPSAPADFLTMRFLDLIDELSPEHFVLLECARDPLAWYRRRDLDVVHTESRFEVLDGAGLGVPASLLGLMTSDLQTHCLLEADLRTHTVGPFGPYNPMTTTVGEDLLGFVALDPLSTR